jgi:hypothetical protein
LSQWNDLVKADTVHASPLQSASMERHEDHPIVGPITRHLVGSINKQGFEHASCMHRIIYAPFFPDDRCFLKAEAREASDGIPVHKSLTSLHFPAGRTSLMYRPVRYVRTCGKRSCSMERATLVSLSADSGPRECRSEKKGACEGMLRTSIAWNSSDRASSSHHFLRESSISESDLVLRFSGMAKDDVMLLFFRNVLGKHLLRKYM